MRRPRKDKSWEEPPKQVSPIPVSSCDDSSDVSESTSLPGRGKRTVYRRSSSPGSEPPQICDQDIKIDTDGVDRRLSATPTQNEVVDDTEFYHTQERREIIDMVSFQKLS